MQQILLIAALLVIQGCSVLPSPEEQREAFASQTFGEAYRIGVTSWYQDAKYDFRHESSPNSKSDADFFKALNNSISILAKDQADNGAEWSIVKSRYNHRSIPSSIDRLLANTLEESLGTTPVFIPRTAVGIGISNWDSPMHHAKAIAADKGYDAVAMIYFRPRVLGYYSTVSGSDNLGYELTYESQLAMRSIAGDKLMYSSSTVDGCEDTVQKYRNTTTPDSYTRFHECEQEIHAKIMEKFKSFASSALPNRAAAN